MRVYNTTTKEALYSWLKFPLAAFDLSKLSLTICNKMLFINQKDKDYIQHVQYAWWFVFLVN